MPLLWTKVCDYGQHLHIVRVILTFMLQNWGGKHFGGGMRADKSGVHRNPFRCSFCGLSCFK